MIDKLPCNLHKDMLKFLQAPQSLDLKVKSRKLRCRKASISRIRAYRFPKMSKLLRPIKGNF